MQSSRTIFHVLKRLRRAAERANHFESLCIALASKRTALEAEAYAAWVNGHLNFALEDWEAAKGFFQKAVHIYSELAALTTVGTRRQRDFFKERVDEISPLERYCRYELGEKGDVVGMLVDGQVRTTFASR